jgi:hypothetical protein
MVLKNGQHFPREQLQLLKWRVSTFCVLIQAPYIQQTTQTPSSKKKNTNKSLQKQMNTNPLANNTSLIEEQSKSF